MVTPPGLHPADLSAETLLQQCDQQRTRRSGPGGQHRNKVETCLVLTHRPTGVRAEAGERRSLSENQAMALRRLRLRLAIEVRADRDLESVPSALWQSRCHAGRISVNENHEDYPSLLAEAFDLLQQTGWDPKSAAEKLTCTPSQLLKFLKQEPQAWTALLAQRRQNGLPDLH